MALVNYSATGSVYEQQPFNGCCSVELGKKKEKQYYKNVHRQNEAEPNETHCATLWDWLGKIPEQTQNSA